MPRYKSAETGKFVSAKYAGIHPDTTYMVASKKRKTSNANIDVAPEVPAVKPTTEHSFWDKVKRFFTRG